jgi:hypothetical protein
MDALGYFEVERLNLLGCLRHDINRVGDNVPGSELGPWRKLSMTISESVWTSLTPGREDTRRS